MSGKEIRFSCKGQDYVFKEGEKIDKEGKFFLRKNKFKNIKPLFEAIVNSDGKKEISADEIKMLEKLKVIVEKTGDNTDNILDKDDLSLGAEFSKSKKSVGDFLDAKLAELNKPEGKKTPEQPVISNEDIQKIVDDITKNGLPHLRKKKVEQEEKPVVEEKKKTIITQQDKNKQFNAAIQNSAKKYDKNTLNFTEEVSYVKGKYLTHIAKEALQSEGIQSPTQRQIWDRLAQIALANDIKDVNNVPESKYPLKVGTGKSAPIAPNGDPNRGNSPVANRGTGTIPVQTPQGGMSISKDTDLKGWTVAKVKELEGLDLQGGTLKVYSKGDGENADIKFTYTKDNVTFEAKDVEELTTKIKTLNEGLTELTTAPENETAEGKQARIQGALDKIMSLGNESAVKFAQQKLAENKANVTVDYYAEKTIAMLKSGNVALIEEMLGSEGTKFAELVNNNPEVQKAVGEVVKYLKDKFDNDEYLTLDEQKIKAILDKCVDKGGVSIAAKAAVAEVKDEQGNVTTPAQTEVFAKTMVTDNEGNSYYKATLGGEGAFKDVEFRAKDDKALDAFLAELKVADTDEKKTALFKKYAEMENVDTELIKSMVKNASTFKADAETVIALVNKSNLDVIYAMDTSHFVDTEQNAETEATGAKDKTNVQNAIKARIEAIMADPALAKLPENAKYLDKIKGIEIPAESTAVNKNTDVSEWGDPTTKKYILENDAWKEVTDDTSDAVEVKTYTKDDKTVHQITTKIAGLDVTLEANSQEDALKLKQELDTIQFKVETPLSEEDKAHNTECLNKILATTNNKEAIDVVIKVLKNANYVNHNLPETKALVQKLLLTRDADIVRALVKTEGSVDDTLFGNDPVALKTLAAMFKEIRDKEKLPDPDNKLTPEQIALKDVLLGDAMNNNTVIDGEYIAFDDTGLYQCYGSLSNNLQLGKDFEAAWFSTNSAERKQAVIEKFLNDPRVKEDKNFLLYLADSDDSNNNIDRPFNDATPAQQKAIIELIKDNARALARVDLSNVPDGNTDAEKAAAMAVKDAYVEAARNLFQYDTPAEGAKLDPANASYLNSILDEIDSISSAGSEEGAVDPDKAVIEEILGQFFVTTGEGDSAVTTIKDFRRFTYEEMLGLADAVAKHGTDAQKTALANMITIEDMEDGQFVRAIELRTPLDNNIRTKYAEYVNGMTTKEEVLEFIDKMKFPDYHIPFDKIMEKFPEDTDIQKKLAENLKLGSKLSKENLEKLLPDSNIKGSSFEYNKNVYHNKDNDHYIYNEETKEVEVLDGVTFVDKNGFCWDNSKKKVLGKIVDGKYEPIELTEAAKNANYRTTNTKGVFYDENARKHYYFDNTGNAVEMAGVGFIDENGNCYKCPNKKQKVGKFKDGKFTATTT